MQLTLVVPWHMNLISLIDRLGTKATAGVDEGKRDLVFDQLNHNPGSRGEAGYLSRRIFFLS